MDSLRRSNLEWAALATRLAFGVLFFCAGLGKFQMGYSGVVEGLAGGFRETWLPMALVWPYAYALPFVELAIGVLLLVGLFTRPALIVTGLLLVSLTFGMAIKGEHDVVAHNLFYAVLSQTALLLSEWNRFSLDRMLFEAKSAR